MACTYLAAPCRLALIARHGEDPANRTRACAHGSQNIIEAAYIIVFGLATAGLEFQIPAQVQRYASFMFSFLGRGVFYVFVGSILLDSFWAGYASGAIVGVVGLAYVVLEFLPQIEPPPNMREADGGWGAEQV